MQHAVKISPQAATETRNIWFLRQLDDKRLLHAPLHGVSALLNRAGADALQRRLHGEAGQPLTPALQSILDKLTTTVEPPRPHQGAYRPRTLSLLPTIDCNLRCRYCGPEAGDARLGPLSQAHCETALRQYAKLARRQGYRSFSLYYFGGEPFLAWPTVQFCDRLGRQLAERLGIPFHVTATTNGLMAPTKARWLARHLRYAVVSIDGAAATHDHNRPTRNGGGSHAQVVKTLELFQRHGLPYTLRCTVDADALPRLVDNVRWLLHRFQPHQLNIEPVLEHGRCAQYQVRAPAPEGFLRAVAQCAELATQQGIKLKLSTAQIERMADSYCGITEDNCVITPDGGLSACYYVNRKDSAFARPWLIGELDDQGWTIDARRLTRIRNFGVDQIPRCADCFCKWHCGGGCRLFHSRPGQRQPRDALCRTTRLLSHWQILKYLQLHDAAARFIDEAEHYHVEA